MNLILLNLFLAILLQNFETTDEEKDGGKSDSEEKTLKKVQRRLEKVFKRCCNSCMRACPCLAADEEDESEDDLEIKS